MGTEVCGGVVTFTFTFTFALCLCCLLLKERKEGCTHRLSALGRDTVTPCGSGDAEDREAATLSTAAATAAAAAGPIPCRE